MLLSLLRYFILYMTEPVPIYLAYTNSDDRCHICVGVDPSTLCGDSSITSAVQVSESHDPVDILEGDDSSELCSECEDKWTSISDKVNSEPTVECHRCKSEYAASLARMVTHQTDGDKPICRPCYKELLNDESSGVSVPYSEAEPFRDVRDSDQNRKMNFELNEE